MLEYRQPTFRLYNAGIMGILSAIEAEIVGTYNPVNSIFEREILMAHLCAGVFWVMTVPLAGAMVLRVSVGLINAVARGSRQEGVVPMPGWGKAAVLSIGVWGVQVVGAWVFSAACDIGDTFHWPLGVHSWAAVAWFPITVFLAAGMLTVALPTTYRRALIVAACWLTTIATILVVFLMIFFAALVMSGFKG